VAEESKVLTSFHVEQNSRFFVPRGTVLKGSWYRSFLGGSLDSLSCLQMAQCPKNQVGEINFYCKKFCTLKKNMIEISIT